MTGNDDTVSERSYSVSWYGQHAAIAQADFFFARERALDIAIAGAIAPDFWRWADEQSFAVHPVSIYAVDDPGPARVARADIDIAFEDFETVWESVREAPLPPRGTSGEGTETVRSVAGSITFGAGQDDTFASVLEEMVGETVRMSLHDGSSLLAVLVRRRATDHAGIVRYVDYEIQPLGTMAAENASDFEGGGLPLDVAEIADVHVLGAHESGEPPRPARIEGLAPDEVIVEVGWAYGVPGERESGAGAWFVAARLGTSAVTDPEAALRRVAAAYAASLDPHEATIEPNWGDVFTEATPEQFAAEGFRLVAIPSLTRVSVNHDETFELPDVEVYEVPPETGGRTSDPSASPAPRPDDPDAAR